MTVAYSSDQRSVIVEKIIEGLSVGTPLAVLCRQEGMPCRDTVYEWEKEDASLSRRIARAREDGYDQIALDALAIADHAADDTIVTEAGERPNAEWISRSKLRVQTRLDLLAKWDPKRYGNRTTHAGDPDAPIAYQEVRRTIVDPNAT